PLSIKAINISNQIKNSNSVSIHVRRGDYVGNIKTLNFHGVCEIDYYIDAINSIKQKVQNPLFFIFSDDIEWCKNNIKDENSIFIDFERDDYVDMYLMTVCKHNIIANSSFSYWAAYLNQNFDKIVIAPKKWFKDDNQNKRTEGLIPEKWIRI
ncbi:MAG TPA: alpha-1,2-fucosyltransferase, partial [Spirochaetota bacterium]|nr:alpha-1,2-fucosyltransferase [Spirochaetota bacterium]